LNVLGNLVNLISVSIFYDDTFDKVLFYLVEIFIRLVRMSLNRFLVVKTFVYT
jgi:hypothetical protein